jgi:hypothetical protein
MADTDDFEAEFARLLKQAGALPLLVADAAARPAGNRQLRGADFPKGTVWRLQQWADVELAAVLRVLGEPRTSPTAYSLIRGLVEVWAHNYFIYADDVETEWRCRALQLELGMQLSIQRALEATAAIDRDLFAEHLAAAAGRVRQVSDVKSKEGCRGSARDHRHVQGTLKELTRRYQELDWVVPMWKSSSVTAHQFGSDWLLTDLGGGRIGVVDPPPSRRVGHFDHGLTAYVNASELYLRIMKADTKPLRRDLNSLRGSAFFRAALAEEFD